MRACDCTLTTTIKHNNKTPHKTQQNMREAMNGILVSTEFTVRVVVVDEPNTRLLFVSKRDAMPSFFFVCLTPSPSESVNTFINPLKIKKLR